MPWLTFAIVLLVTFVVQLSVVHVLGLRSLDLFLVLTLLLALRAPAHEARIAGWVAGLVQSLQSDVRFGVEPFSLGLTAFLLTGLRGLVNTDVWWARLLVVLVAAIPGQLFTVLVDWVFDVDARNRAGFFTVVGAAMWVSLLAAVLATLASAAANLWYPRRGGFRPTGRWA